jgi:hypothetical protein
VVEAGALVVAMLEVGREELLPLLVLVEEVELLVIFDVDDVVNGPPTLQIESGSV